MRGAAHNGGQTLEGFVINNRDGEICRLRRLGTWFSLTFLALWVGTTIAFALYAQAHQICI